MKLVKATIKNYDDFPPQERCCSEASRIQSPYNGLNLIIDLEDTMEYEDIVGHCGQELGYKIGFRVVKSDIDATGYVPLEVLNIEKGHIGEN